MSSDGDAAYFGGHTIIYRSNRNDGDDDDNDDDTSDSEGETCMKPNTSDSDLSFIKELPIKKRPSELSSAQKLINQLTKKGKR